MDSRIREIEQWIAEAKTDLGERGREAYLNKLYLLDAEIRSVIRENGMPPGAASPQPSGQRVRRPYAIPAFASGAALGALLLAASTVYFASPGVGLPWGGQRSAAQSPLVALAPAATPAADRPLDLPAGEELVSAPGAGAAHHLTPLLSSPSEEKAGNATPSNKQASGTEASLPGNSKPSALAHPSVPAPASFSPSKSVNSSKMAAVKAPPAKPMAPLTLASFSRRDAAQPPAGKTDPKHSAKGSAIPVELAPASAQPVDNTPVDSGDKARKINEKALTSVLEDTLSGKLAH